MLPRVRAACAAVGPLMRIPPTAAPRPISFPPPATVVPGSGELCEFDARQLIDAYGAGRVNPCTVIDALLARVTDIDGGVGAMWAMDEVGARRAAMESTHRWQSGTARPLDGVPIVVKDLLDTAGLATTGGSGWLTDRVPTENAAVVAAVHRAGAIVIGKTATFELGCGDESTPFGTVRNPWNRAHTTGGSSAGSAAALAMRFAPLAIGTDTGGSIRIPSSYCGVTGLKPTLGRLSTVGLLGLAPSLDAPGPMARSAADVSLLFAAMTAAESSHAQPVGVEPYDSYLHGVRIGLPTGWLMAVLTEEVAEAFELAVDCLARLGATIVPVELTVAQHGAPLSWLITMYEAAELYADVSRDLLTPAFRGRLEVGDRIAASDYRAAMEARQRLTWRVVSAFDGLDALVVPGSVSTAPRFDDLYGDVAGVAATWPDVHARTMALWNVTGFPSVNVPIGHGAGRLPIGMQIVARHGADETCLALAVAYQTATDHHLRSPDCNNGSWKAEK